jgi:hypothetical protein
MSGAENRLRSEIKWDLLQLPDDNLNEAASFIKFLLEKNTKLKRKKNKALKNSLSHTDLNDIDLEKEIRSLRSESEANIGKRWKRQNM